jgi:hypothetical protein
MIRDRELARTNGHCKSFDEDVPIRTIYDFSDCDSNPQTILEDRLDPLISNQLRLSPESLTPRSR